MLTDAKCRAAKATEKLYRLADSNGLCLEVKPNGVKAWRYRYKLAGKENMFAIGDYPSVSLQDARKARDTARELVRNGLHPAQNRQLERIVRAQSLADTLEGVALEWMQYNKPHWSESYAANVKRRLEVDCFPAIGRLPVADVKPAHILDMLRKIEKRSSTQAKLVQTWVGGVFRYAVVNLRREDDPCFPLRRAIKTATQVRHHAILKTEREVGAFLRAINSAVGEFSTKAAVFMLWLTMGRVNEVVGARWEEFDFERGLWIIPAERMKARHEHIVPLSPAAVELINSLRPLSGICEHLFPHRSDRKNCMSPEAVRDLFRRAGYQGKFTPHGIRGTFSSMANNAKFRADAIELCLAHKDKDQIRAAYNHAPLIEERRELLTWWADMLETWKTGGDVITLKQRGGAA